MNQAEMLKYLVDQFKAESEEYRGLPTPDDPAEQRRLLRSLMNLRMPKPMPEEVLRVQDAYLTERAVERGVVHLSEIPVIRGCTYVGFVTKDRVLDRYRHLIETRPELF